MIDGRINNSVMDFKTIPIVKLSMLTEKARSILLIKDKSKLFSSLENKEINISMPINMNTINNSLLGLIDTILLKKVPRYSPNKGIIKWKIPTSEENNNIFLLLILNVPIDRANEKVSIDRDTPIIISINIFILHYILDVFIYDIFYIRMILYVIIFGLFNIN